jgi:glutamate-1-semialdehyde 2,1-aminomutase
MLQFYLRAEGLALSWIGTGRIVFSLTYTDADFGAVADRFVAAAKAMHQDGWWWCSPTATNKSIRRSLLREMLAHRLAWTRPVATPGPEPRTPGLVSAARASSDR